MQTLITKPIRKILIENHKRGIEIRSTLDDDGNEQDIDFAPVLKLFCPWNKTTWLITELDPETNIAFGLGDLGIGFPELGYISIDELKAIKHPSGLTIERDRHFNAYGRFLNGFAKDAGDAGRITA